MFSFFAGLVVGSVLIAGGLLLGGKSEEKVMGLIFIAFGTLPLIKAELDDLPFALGCLTPATVVSLFVGMLAWGYHRSPRAFQQGKNTFFYCALPCLPLLVARLFF